MNRNIILVCSLLLLCSTFTSAQTQRTVEVIISDTINLRATSFEYKIAYGEDKSMFSAMASMLIVTMTSEAELDGLCKKLAKIQGLKGKIQNVQYEKPDAYLNALFVRLYAAAARQAGEIAKVSGNSTGKVIAMAEIATMSATGNSYENLMSEMTKKMPFAAMYDSTESLTQTYSRKMSFRFELN